MKTKTHTIGELHGLMSYKLQLENGKRNFSNLKSFGVPHRIFQY